MRKRYTENESNNNENENYTSEIVTKKANLAP
jgi:hypothetical protein